MEESLMMLEMQLKEDNDFIQELNFKTSVSDKSERGGEIQDEVPQHEVVLVFPEGESDSVRIINSDIESLQPGEFLSGNLVDFYIKYLLKRLSSTSQSRFHSFKSSFYSELVKTHGATKSEQCEASFEKDLMELTGEINIFEKAYVFIPVNQSSHWSLIIICYLDSLTNSPARSYLRNAWRARYQDLNENLFQMRYRKVKVPQQANNYECGIYLLEFVELFLYEWADPHFIPNHTNLFTTLWNAEEVSAKRETLKLLIQELRLVSIRKSREHQTMLLRNFLLHPPNLDYNSNGHMEEPHAGAGDDEHVDHGTEGEVAPVSQQHTGTKPASDKNGDMVLSDSQQQPGQVPFPALQRLETRQKKRSRNSSKEETSILLDCKKEGGRFCKGNQGITDWNEISKEIEKQLRTNPDPPSGDQCRLRYDTLLKAYKKSYDYCMKNDKQFSELPLGGLKLATYLSEDWYNAIDELCRRLPHGSSKRRKFSLQSSDDNSSVQHHSFSLSASRYMSATSCSTVAFSRHSRLRPCSDSSSVETDSDSSSVGSDSDSNLVENDQASTTPRNSLTFVLFLEGTTLPAPYRLATVQEVQANQKALFQAMPRWQIANLADGSVTGKLYGGHTKAERRNDVHHQLATSYPIICKGTEPIQEDYELIARDISYPGFLPYSTVESIKREAAIRAVITKKGSPLKFPKPKLLVEMLKKLVLGKSRHT
ncbi:hypothetical protein M758_4G117300 [Ceratodon purpureus]|nr:hypothetical protein M758_4G117300 [Ceratodon purpureus]